MPETAARSAPERFQYLSPEALMATARSGADAGAAFLNGALRPVGGLPSVAGGLSGGLEVAKQGLLAIGLGGRGLPGVPTLSEIDAARALAARAAKRKVQQGLNKGIERDPFLTARAGNAGQNLVMGNPWSPAEWRRASAYAPWALRDMESRQGLAAPSPDPKGRALDPVSLSEAAPKGPLLDTLLQVLLEPTSAAAEEPQPRSLPP